MSGEAFHHHDHQQCVAGALSRAVQVCEARGARLTPLRARVLTLLWTNHQPLGAYEVLQHLGGDGPVPAPPTVYRALDFLVAHGLAHRIASRNAFVGCSGGSGTHSGCFLLCRACGNADEMDAAALDDLLQRLATVRGFAVERQILELEGLCAACQRAAGGGA